MNSDAIVMLVVVSVIFATGITFCLYKALSRARAESYGEEDRSEE